MVSLILDVILDETALPYPGQRLCSLRKKTTAWFLASKLHPSVDWAAVIFVPQEEANLPGKMFIICVVSFIEMCATVCKIASFIEKSLESHNNDNNPVTKAVLASH